jgi:hypothetical protein
MIKVSVTTEYVRNLIDLKIKVEKTPKNNPINVETIATRKNYMVKSHNVWPENSLPCKESIAT